MVELAPGINAPGLATLKLGGCQAGNSILEFRHLRRRIGMVSHSLRVDVNQVSRLGVKWSISMISALLTCTQNRRSETLIG